MRRRIVPALAGLLALAAAGALAQAVRARPASLAVVEDGRAVAGPDGVQTVTLRVRGGAYAPNRVELRAGAPLRLRVAVEDVGGCATRLLVPDLGVDLALVPRGTAEVVVPSLPRGAWLFTCGERMVKGVLVAE